MITKRNYITEEERDSIIQEQTAMGFTLIEEANHIDENYLIFTDIVIQSKSEKELQEILGDDFMVQIRTLTPQQVANWIDTNVNNLAEAKQVLKILAKVVVYIVRNKGL